MDGDSAFNQETEQFKKLKGHYVSSQIYPANFQLFLSIFMSCVVSAVSVFNTTGLIDGFFNLWMTAWLKSWIVAFPTILVVAPLTRRLVGKLVRNTPS